MGINEDRQELPDMGFLGEGLHGGTGNIFISFDQEVIGEYLHARVPYLPGVNLNMIPDWAHPFLGTQASTEGQTKEALADSVGLHMLVGIYVAHKAGLNVDEETARMMRILHKRIQDDSVPVEYEGLTPEVPDSSATGS